MGDTTGIEQFLPLLLLCCMLPLLMRPQESQRQAVTTEMDIWFTSYNDEEAYDTVLKATDEIRERAEAEAKAKKSRFSFLRRGRKERYTVDQTIPPHLHKITDRDYGLMQFELSDAEGGGTQVKATFSERNKAFVQSIKTKMPSRKLVAVAGLTACSSCGKPRQPEWQVCPYCGNKYS